MKPERDEGQSFAATGPQDQTRTDSADSATDAQAEHQTRVAQADKVFQGWRARFAIAGWALYITAADGQAKFVVTRWGQLREFDSLVELEAFAARIGAQA